MTSHRVQGNGFGIAAWAFALGLAGVVACGGTEAATGTSRPETKSAEKNKGTTKSAEKTEDEPSEPASSDAPSPSPAPTPMTDAGTPAFPRLANNDECAVGNGLYCGGNGVVGTAGKLYRCANGTISEERTCATSCLFMPPGKHDACDGDAVPCPFGNGLYCGQNGLSGDAKTLYRCTAGVVTVEQACNASCVTQAIGVNDYCE